MSGVTDVLTVSEKCCSKCRLVIPLDMFSSSKIHKDGLRGVCKSCRKQESATRRIKDRDTAQSDKRHRLYLKLGKLRRKCRERKQVPLCITLEELMASPDDVCHICGQVGPTQIDHCHETGKFRGFLCGRCNRLLGFALNNISILRKAVRYLIAFDA